MSYIGEEGIIEVSSTFMYLEEIYQRTPKRWNILKSTCYSSSVPIIRSKKEIKNEDYRYNPDTQIAIVRCWELISAPEEYLIKNNYKKL